MASTNNIYPLFFTLERVHNGYILTAKEETGGLKETAYRKEVVMEDKINTRIGQMLHLDAMIKEHPVVFHVEAVGETTYDIATEHTSNDITEAKLAYVHINSKDIKDGSVLALLITDTNIIEVYGMEAESCKGQQPAIGTHGWHTITTLSQHKRRQEGTCQLFRSHFADRD